jgi:hypothetical protein
MDAMFSNMAATRLIRQCVGVRVEGQSMCVSRSENQWANALSLTFNYSHASMAFFTVTMVGLRRAELYIIKGNYLPGNYEGRREGRVTRGQGGHKDYTKQGEPQQKLVSSSLLA